MKQISLPLSLQSLIQISAFAVVCLPPGFTPLVNPADHSQPITFPTFAAVFFNAVSFQIGGMIFTEVATGNLVGRSEIDICGPGGDHGLHKDNEKDFVTPHPRQKHAIMAVIQRRLSREQTPTGLSEIPTVEEFIEAYAKIPKVWKWVHARGLDDRKTYEIGIDANALIIAWYEGAKEELLSRLYSERSEDVMSTYKTFFPVDSYMAALCADREPNWQHLRDGSILVGYAQGSRNVSELDIMVYVKWDKGNEISFAVHRSPDATYIEDQDK
ncbi:hypothetical protein FZEAL_6341 [Fusarium zealandicum]|uniref:Uncharacterized protein n=1 Tax=Fusarium zealandicum TaxID=1053134 RepID=A0A8H4UIS0_9HYPO|nr:hypothetical protein FZEAL_6341 [Fusarium zealandicum]